MNVADSELLEVYNLCAESNCGNDDFKSFIAKNDGLMSNVAFKERNISIDSKCMEATETAVTRDRFGKKFF